MKECSQCQRSFKPRNGRQVVCSPTCARERHLAQMKARRASTRSLPQVLGCLVCKEVFSPRTSNQKYCSREECKAEGLRRAVIAQNARRMAARINGGKYSY